MLSQVSSPNALGSLFDLEAVESVRRELKADPRLVQLLKNVVCKKFGIVGQGGATPRQLLGNLEACVAFQELASRLTVDTLTLAERQDSRLDGATKLLFRNVDSLLLESVILRFRSGRSSVCVSSQVGCAAGCTFCATGKMGVARSLTTHEILDQVVQSGRILTAEGRALRNVVFMGMGEPLHNEKSVSEAIARLTARDYFDLPASRILVSSVGVPDGMLRLAERFPRVHQALSLHSVDADVRQQLIPLARHTTLDELRDTVSRLNELQSCPVMLEYLLLGDMNDSPSDAVVLAKWARDLRVHINLIPFNDVDAAAALRPSSRQHEFSGILKSEGFKVTTRNSLGRDIAAACGQLVQQVNRRIVRIAQRSKHLE